ncbi:unnamed protein product [Closterium sp. NIES-54]
MRRQCSLVGIVELTVSLAPEAGDDFQAVAAIVQENLAVVLLDSGCSHHLMGTKEAFVDLQPNGEVKHVRSFNGALKDVRGRGIVALQGEAEKQVLIPDMLYVPGVQANLLSACPLHRPAPVHDNVDDGHDGGGGPAANSIGEFLGKEFTTLVDGKGIVHDLTCPYTPQQNGMAEREMRTVVESVRTMLLHMGVQDHWWHLAPRQAVWVRNCLERSTLPPGTTPYQLLTGRKPDLSLAQGPVGPGQYTHRYVGDAAEVETCVSSLGACVVSNPGASEVLSVGAAATTSLVPAFVAGSGATSPTAQLSFSLDSGVLSCFFRDCTALTPRHTPVTVALADPSMGSVVAQSTTILPCPAAPSGLLTCYYTPLFSRNLVGVSHLHNLGVVTTFPLDEPVASCTVSATGVPLATFHRESGSGLLDLLAPLPRSPAPTCTLCVKGRQRAAPHSSSFPPTTAPFQTLHLDVWGPSPVRGPRQERYFLIVVDDYS